MAKVDEYKMFAGCTIGNRIPFIEASSRKVFDKLGIKTSDAAFACCPDPVPGTLRLPKLKEKTLFLSVMVAFRH